MTRSFTRLALGTLALALMTTAFTPAQNPKQEAHYRINAQTTFDLSLKEVKDLAQAPGALLGWRACC